MIQCSTRLCERTEQVLSPLLVYCCEAYAHRQSLLNLKDAKANTCRVTGSLQARIILLERIYICIMSPILVFLQRNIHMPSWQKMMHQIIHCGPKVPPCSV